MPDRKFSPKTRGGGYCTEHLATQEWFFPMLFLGRCPGWNRSSVLGSHLSNRETRASSEGSQGSNHWTLSFLAPGPSPSPWDKDARIARTRSLADWGVSSTAILDSGPSAS